MITPELLSYISQQVAMGKTKDQIKLSLIQGGGWRGSDIDEAFANMDHPFSSKKPHKHSSGLTVFAIVILIVAAAYFVAGRFNIHSLQDVMNLISGTTSQ